MLLIRSLAIESGFRRPLTDGEAAVQGRFQKCMARWLGIVTIEGCVEDSNSEEVAAAMSPGSRPRRFHVMRQRTDSVRLDRWLYALVGVPAIFFGSLVVCVVATIPLMGLVFLLLGVPGALARQFDVADGWRGVINGVTVPLSPE